MKYIVGGYAASPCSDSWDPALEAEFWKALRAMPLVGGLEIPFYGQLHKFDEAFLLENLSPEWSNIVTLIPGTMDRLGQNPSFGLASFDQQQRKAALAFVGHACDAIKRLNHKVGRRAVRAVEFHSAPSLTASEDALAESISEFSLWDWAGAELLVEHCDAVSAAHSPSKGFLSLPQEIGAIMETVASASPIGISINWGRSAIEGRSPDLPIEHIKQAREAGLLKALIFSGAAAEDPHHGNWRDSHAPFAAADAPLFGAPGSLLTKKRANACIQAAGVSDLIVGIKMQPLPKSTTLHDRIGMIKEALEIVNECVSSHL